MQSTASYCVPQLDRQLFQEFLKICPTSNLDFHSGQGSLRSLTQCSIAITTCLASRSPLANVCVAMKLDSQISRIRYSCRMLSSPGSATMNADASKQTPRITVSVVLMFNTPKRRRICCRLRQGYL